MTDLCKKCAYPLYVSNNGICPECGTVNDDGEAEDSGEDR